MPPCPPPLDSVLFIIHLRHLFNECRLTTRSISMLKKLNWTISTYPDAATPPCPPPLELVLLIIHLRLYCLFNNRSLTPRFMSMLKNLGCTISTYPGLQIPPCPFCILHFLQPLRSRRLVTCEGEVKPDHRNVISMRRSRGTTSTSLHIPTAEHKNVLGWKEKIS